MRFFKENIGLKISEIENKQFLFNTPHSSFHRVKIGETSLILKEFSDPLWESSKIIRSYENYQKIKSNSIVKIYDYYLEDNGKTSVLMEDLDGYENLIKIVVPNLEYKDIILHQILDLFDEMWDRGFINYDFTIINFMVKDETIKMIDLEFIDQNSNMNLYRMIWFLERIDIIKNWHGNCNDEIMEIKERVLLKWK